MQSIQCNRKVVVMAINAVDSFCNFDQATIDVD